MGIFNKIHKLIKSICLYFAHLTSSHETQVCGYGTSQRVNERRINQRT
jgi:hypothetical protein